MAGGTDTIREFLVQLGWKIDEKGQKKFTDSIAAGTLRVVELGAAIEATAAGVIAGVAKIAGQMESLYFASQRTNASVSNIQALGFAASQMGASAAEAQGSLESLARFMRTSPGSEGLIRSIGVQARDMNGQLRDATDIMSDLGKQFANMPYYRANAYAKALGIDEKTLMAMRQGMGQAGDEYKAMLKAAGLDSQEAAKKSHTFMNEVRSLGAAFAILGQKTASTLTGGIAGDIRKFRDGMVSHFGKISTVITKVAKGVLWLADMISSLVFRAMQLAGDVVEWFDKWDDGAKKAAAAIGLILVAWKLLNSGILATPIGIVLTLGSAILALYDDYKTWKEGGKSLIDWGKWEPDIKAALANLELLADKISTLASLLTRIFGPALEGIGRILTTSLKAGFGNLLDLVTLITDILTGKWEEADKKAKGIMDRTVAAGKDILKVGADAAVQTGENLSASMQGQQVPNVPGAPSGANTAAPKIAEAPISAGVAKASSGSAAFGGGFLGSIANSAFGALISKGEGDYNSVNRGAAGGYRAGKEDLSNMTVAQVMAAQRAHQFNAAGRYQLIGSTLADAVKSLGLKGDEKFDKGTQDRIFERYLLNNKRKAIGDYISGKSNDLMGAIHAASLEWASVADPRTGRSHYAGVGNNKASISVAEMERALQSARLTATGNPYAGQMLATASAGAGMAGKGGAQTVINQTNNTTVHGAGDPRATAQAVASAQEGTNQRLIRNLKSATA